MRGECFSRNVEVGRHSNVMGYLEILKGSEEILQNPVRASGTEVILDKHC